MVKCTYLVQAQEGEGIIVDQTISADAIRDQVRDLKTPAKEIDMMGQEVKADQGRKGEPFSVVPSKFLSCELRNVGEILGTNGPNYIRLGGGGWGEAREMLR